MSKESLYLFLDMDGVLNTPSWGMFVYMHDSKPRDHERELDPRSLGLFNHMCKEINRYWDLKIIISSTWRGGINSLEELQEKFLSYGIAQAVSGSTGPHMDTRGEEISAFIKEHSRVTNYIILDDETDAVIGHDTLRFVWTNPMSGFNVNTYQEVLYRIGFYDKRCAKAADNGN